MIKVIVGAEKTPFQVHKHFICEVSPFFKTACNSTFWQSQTGTINLPACEPETFDIFLRMTYCRFLEFPQFPSGIDEAREWWLSIVKLYNLTQFLLTPALGNCVIDYITLSIKEKSISFTFFTSVISQVYSSTVAGSGLRRLIVAIAVWRPNQADLDNSTEGWKKTLGRMPAEFRNDLVIDLFRRIAEVDRDPFMTGMSRAEFRDKDEKGRKLSWAQPEALSRPPAWN